MIYKLNDKSLAVNIQNKKKLTGNCIALSCVKIIAKFNLSVKVSLAELIDKTESKDL